MDHLHVQLRVNRIDGRNVAEHRWVCNCGGGLEGPWHKADLSIDLHQEMALEHNQMVRAIIQERVSQN